MPKRRKRSLGQTGGPAELSGDPVAARMLGHCLDVDPEAKLPFTHGFHAYPARMHPETARRALEAFPGGRILDPFVGSGTTAVEAVRAGRPFVGLDISRVPLEIAWARTRVLVPDASRRVEERALRLANQAFGVAESGDPLPEWARGEREWYDPHTLREIAILKGLIDLEPEEFSRRMLTVILSSVLVKLSRQISDSDVKPDRDHRPRPRGATFRWFRDRSNEVTSGLLKLGSDLYKRKVPFLEPELRRDDARTTALPRGAFDLVLTSPPYSGVYDYARHQSRRYPIFGEDPSFAEAHEMGSRRNPESYPEDLEAALRNLMGALAPGGKALLLLGDGRHGDGRRLLERLAARAGGRVWAAASQKRHDWSGGAPRGEHLVLVVGGASPAP